jgi:hypothetical protein
MQLKGATHDRNSLDSLPDDCYDRDRFPNLWSLGVIYGAGCSMGSDWRAVGGAKRTPIPSG